MSDLRGRCLVKLAPLDEIPADPEQGGLVDITGPSAILPDAPAAARDRRSSSTRAL